MIFGARFVIYLTFLLMFVFALKGGVRERKALILAALSIPVLVLIIKSIHIFYFEERPFVALEFDPLIEVQQDAAFPSRHASIMAAIAFSYFYFKSKWALLFLLLLVWVGVSRIYAGVHYPIDIIGGFLVGIIAAFFGLTLLKQLYRRLFAG